MMWVVAPPRGLRTKILMICLVVVVAAVLGRLLHFGVRVADIVTPRHSCGKRILDGRNHAGVAVVAADAVSRGSSC